MSEEVVTNDLMIYQEKQISNVISIFDRSPVEIVKYATSIADALGDVIEAQKLYTQIGPNKYIRAEGWATMGTMLGILPRERDVKELSDGSFEAFVDLIRQSDGKVIGGASSLCGTEEKRWGNADRFARRSMAITRATGKAYRLSFSWIVTLRGYSPTPYEEMVEEDYNPIQKRALEAIARHPTEETRIKSLEYFFANYRNDKSLESLTQKLAEKKTEPKPSGLLLDVLNAVEETSNLPGWSKQRIYDELGISSDDELSKYSKIKLSATLGLLGSLKKNVQ
jgi:hypothetical protein